MNFNDNQTISELLSDIKRQRIIPFIGAGFSKFCGLPSWIELLEKLSQKFSKEHGMSNSDILRFSNNDPLKIAEFLYLINDEKIGPIRREIEIEFSKYKIDVRTSEPHISLINLNFPIIYTTNFDDLLEKTYEEFGLEYQKISTTKDLFQTNYSQTQIVKFHGDLAHEETLVFTETSYYERLNLESAIDIKFRSDLIGKSVLFLGYGFNDINIRIIWFKLRHLMNDISNEALSKSYIVTLDDNPLLAKLYQKVGIKTICLAGANNHLDGYTEFLGYLTDEINKENTVSGYQESMKLIIEKLRNPYFKPFISAKIVNNFELVVNKIDDDNLSDDQLIEIEKSITKFLDCIQNFEFSKGKQKKEFAILSKLLFSSKRYSFQEEFYERLYHEYIYESQYSLPLFEIMTLALFRYDYAWKVENDKETSNYWFLWDKITQAFNSFPPLLYEQLILDAEKWIGQSQQNFHQRKTLTFYEFLKQCKIPSLFDNADFSKKIKELIRNFEKRMGELKEWEAICNRSYESQIVYGNFKMLLESDNFLWGFPKKMIERLYIDGQDIYYPNENDNKVNS